MSGVDENTFIATFHLSFASRLLICKSEELSANVYNDKEGNDFDDVENTSKRILLLLRRDVVSL